MEEEETAGAPAESDEGAASDWEAAGDLAPENGTEAVGVALEDGDVAVEGDLVAGAGAQAEGEVGTQGGVVAALRRRVQALADAGSALSRHDQA